MKYPLQGPPGKHRADWESPRGTDSRIVRCFGPGGTTSPLPLGVPAGPDPIPHTTDTLPTVSGVGR